MPHHRGEVDVVGSSVGKRGSVGGGIVSRGPSPLSGGGGIRSTCPT